MTEPDRPQMTIWRTRIARRITEAIKTHSEYVILIASPLQQWLQERTSMLLYVNCMSCVFLYETKITFVTWSTKPLSSFLSIHQKRYRGFVFAWHTHMYVDNTQIRHTRQDCTYTTVFILRSSPLKAVATLTIHY